MHIVDNLLYGLSIGLQPANILFCFIGVLMGTLVGVLPGIGPIGAISILLPATFRMSPIPAIIMLAGIYYGSQYGGSTTSILVNIPGEAASVATCLDGYQMARQGRAGPALGIAAFGSFIAGTLGLVGLMFFATPLSEIGLKFGPPEFASLIFLGLVLVSYLSRGSLMKAFMMAAFGFVLSCIGVDHFHGESRMTFNLLPLMDGIDLAPIAMGLFGVSEVVENIEKSVTTEIVRTKLRNLFPTMRDWVEAKGAILRGTAVGFFLGLFPGPMMTISSFMSYGIEKRISKDPSKFGKGAIEGVAGPESANNAASSAAFVPLFTLGIPGNTVAALLFGALIIHGIQPGPLLLKDHPDLFWGVLSSMYIGNVMLLVLNLPLIPVWVQVLRIPYRILFPLILIFCLIGSYSLKNSTFDVLLMIMFGIVGYLFRKFDYEGAPLILTFVLGPIFEFNLRTSLMLSKGSLLIFFTRPISAVISIIAIIFFIASFCTYLTKRKKRSESSRGDD